MLTAIAIAFLMLAGTAAAAWLLMLPKPSGSEPDSRWSPRTADQSEHPPQDAKPPSSASRNTRITPNQRSVLLYAEKRGGIEIILKGEVRYDVGQTAGPGDARTVHSLAKRGLLVEGPSNLYRITPAGRIVALETGEQ